MVYQYENRNDATLREISPEYVIYKRKDSEQTYKTRDTLNALPFQLISELLHRRLSFSAYCLFSDVILSNVDLSNSMLGMKITLCPYIFFTASGFDCFLHPLKNLNNGNIIFH